MGGIAWKVTRRSQYVSALARDGEADGGADGTTGDGTAEVDGAGPDADGSGDADAPANPLVQAAVSRSGAVMASRRAGRRIGGILVVAGRTRQTRRTLRQVPLPAGQVSGRRAAGGGGVGFPRLPPASNTG